MQIGEDTQKRLDIAGQFLDVEGGKRAQAESNVPHAQPLTETATINPRR